MIIKRLELGIFAANCYIVGLQNRGMIIDPGSDARTILEEVEKAELNIELIVVTHSHIDHIRALRKVKAETHAPFAMYSPGKGARVRSRFMSTFVRLPSPDIPLSHGQEVKVGNLCFNILYTPGHSPDSICLVGEGVVFSGDTLFQLGIGRTDLPGGSYKELMDSLTKLMTLPDDIKVYPGHGPPTTIGNERNYNPFLKQEQRDDGYET
jgi:glyoxylase-like metal-dependent hydrolase (beta-lactamase superfamily II)